MIDRKELRLGNILIYPKYYRESKEDAFFYVRDIYTDDDYIGLTTGKFQTKVHLDSVNFLPISEKWLLELGAKKHENIIYFPITNLKAELHVEIYGDENVFTLKSQFCELILDDLKFVHRLQNFLYSLSNCNSRLVEQVIA